MTLAGLQWQRAVDFSALTVVIYVVLRWSQDARALRLTLGILALETTALIARALDIRVTAWLLHAAALGAGIVLIVLFQPELRHALNRLEILMRRRERRQGMVIGLEAVGTAAFSVAGAGRGAIIVLTRRDAVNELVSGGVLLGGQVSVEILEAVFRKVSPVHDGATIVEGDRITRVGAVLPLSQQGRPAEIVGHTPSRGHGTVRTLRRRPGGGVRGATRSDRDARRHARARWQRRRPVGSTARILRTVHPCGPAANLPA